MTILNVRTISGDLVGTCNLFVPTAVRAVEENEVILTPVLKTRFDMKKELIEWRFVPVPAEEKITPEKVANTLFDKAFSPNSHELWIANVEVLQRYGFKVVRDNA